MLLLFFSCLFAFADAAAGPCWSRGGLVNHFKVKNPKVWAWGWLSPFVFGDAASGDLDP